LFVKPKELLGGALIVEGMLIPDIFWVDVLRQTGLPPEDQVEVGTYLRRKSANEAILLRGGRFKVDTGVFGSIPGRFLGLVR
jgi:hypothetical protein